MVQNLKIYLDSLDASGKPLEDSLDVTSALHGDDTQLILLVHPHKEGFFCVVEDAASLGPVALHTSRNQILKSIGCENIDEGGAGTFWNIALSCHDENF